MVEELGSDQYLYCSVQEEVVVGPEETTEEREVPHADRRAHAGHVGLAARPVSSGCPRGPAAVHLFDADTGARLPD